MGGVAQRNVGSLLRRLRKGRFAAIFGLGLVLFTLSETEWFQRLRAVRRFASFAHDTHFSMMEASAPPGEVVIVGINGSSLDPNALAGLAGDSEVVRQMRENTWPWPRPIHARVIERIFDAGARIVAVDFAMPSERPGDEELIAVLKKYAGRVVLASVVQDRQIGDSEVAMIHPHPNLAAAAGDRSRGVVVYSSAEDDPVVRRFNTHTSDLKEFAPDLDDGNHDLINFAALSAGLYSGSVVSPRYSEIIPFFGGPRTFDYIPVEQLFVDRIFRGGSPMFKNGESLRGKLVFYGPIAEVLHDVHATPLGTMPGVEMHAHIAAALIEGRRIKDVSKGSSRGFAFLITVLCGVFVLWIRNPVLQISAILGTLALGFVFTHAAFLRGAFFPTASWVFAGAGTGLCGFVYLFVLERLERAQVRKVFGRFVSKRIAEVVLKNAEEFAHARSGERRSVAVLFSDIRSFTAWSENAAPENLVGQLNEYFEAMVPLIEDTEGNAQKFIGDAILAAWGDTHSSGQSEDCRRAVVAAMKMRTVLRDLNAKWQGREDRITISIGIGINHGNVVTGEVGHSERREFTVLGDGVNFASRLESATKIFHTDCLLGETVEELTREFFVFREVGFVRVKGKKKPVHIFTPLSDKSTPAPDWLADYHQALALHRSRDFAGAAALFTGVKQRIGGDDFLCDWYLEIGRRYLADAPGEDWDGSETLMEK